MIIRAFAVSGTNLFVGTWGSSVWRRPLSDMITSVERLSTDLPTHFNLGQNYPNPFNPSTTIEFALPKPGFVTLKVYDLLGREVAVIVADKLAAGRYKYDWDAKGLATGVYLYRLEAGDFVQTRKLILMRQAN